MRRRWPTWWVRVIAFINPGKRRVWSEAVPEKNLKERAYVACQSVLIFPAGGRGVYERHDDYRVWQSTIYRHLAAPIRVYRIQREGQGYGVERVDDKLLAKVAEAVENEGLAAGYGSAAYAGGGTFGGAGAFV